MLSPPLWAWNERAGEGYTHGMAMLCRCFPAFLVMAATACSDGASVDAVDLTVTIENVAEGDALVSADGQSHPVTFAPAVRVIHLPAADAAVRVGEPASAELEKLAEDGNPAPLAYVLDAQPDIDARAVARQDMTTYEDAPLAPGTSMSFHIEVAEGQRLSLASMFGQSNDIFVAALNLEPMPAGEPAGDVSSLLSYYDAGTEQNEEPGTGEHQAPRQENPGDGVVEAGVVTELAGNMDAAGFSYPPIAGVLRVTISSP